MSLYQPGGSLDYMTYQGANDIETARSLDGTEENDNDMHFPQSSARSTKSESRVLKKYGTL